MALGVFVPSLLTQGTERVVNYDKEFKIEYSNDSSVWILIMSTTGFGYIKILISPEFKIEEGGVTMVYVVSADFLAHRAKLRFATDTE